jgi:DUF1680 family protein
VLELDMPVEMVRANQEVQANRGRIAIQRGPIVYCIEQADNPGISYDEYTFSANESLQVEHMPELLGGVTVLRGKNGDGEICQFIPYHAWDNREPGFMQVWIREAEEQGLYSY